MRTIRTFVFETNSSSTHVMSICSEKKYNDFFDKNIGIWSDEAEEILSFEEAIKQLRHEFENDKYIRGNFFDQKAADYEPDPDKIFTVENLQAVLKKYKCVHDAYAEDDDIENINSDEIAMLWMLGEDYRTSEEWAEDDWIEEAFDQTFTTEGGETVVAFGYYGRG